MIELLMYTVFVRPEQEEQIIHFLRHNKERAWVPVERYEARYFRSRPNRVNGILKGDVLIGSSLETAAAIVYLAAEPSGLHNTLQHLLQDESVLGYDVRKVADKEPSDETNG